MITLSYTGAILELSNPLLGDLEASSKGLNLFVSRNGTIRSLVQNAQNYKNVTYEFEEDQHRANEILQFFSGVQENYVEYIDYKNNTWTLNITDKELNINYFGRKKIAFSINAQRWA